jgi:transposase
MAGAYQRQDISDVAWDLLETGLPGRKGTWGGIAHDNRRVINSKYFILRIGAPWQNLLPSYGGWKNTHHRFCRWRDNGTWEALREQLIAEPDYK